ncbi:MAG TPA: aldo/keto reductase [Chloroflexota bacterium]|jgi:diketogulonate reductase-like aldo/keto reductase|nr:aldo/keto reductase [Chloroflexota bacterium]
MKAIDAVNGTGAGPLSATSTIPLRGGGAMPVLGMGTWQLRGQECREAVRTALSLGYRHLDTAEMYGNEAEVGAGLRDSGVDRDEVFLTTKVWPQHFRSAALRRAADDSLRRLEVAYVDLLLLHWPSDEVPLAETVGALNDVAAQGKARAIGVSNFSVAQLQEAVALSAAPVVCDQVQMHVLNPQTTLRRRARAEGIAITAYSPLAKGRLTGHPALTRIGERYGKSASQVAIRWLLQQDGVSAIPKATREPNLRANLEVFDFVLDGDDLAALAALGGA